jgi:hypothetical protein
MTGNPEVTSCPSPLTNLTISAEAFGPGDIVFTELKKLIAKRSLTITVAVLDDEQIRVNVVIVSVDAQGHVTGNLVRRDGGVDAITGFWSESAKKLTFVRTINNPSIIQVFTGYLLNAGTTFCSTGEFNKMMAGSFEAFASTGATRDRTLFGWVARQCVA